MSDQFVQRAINSQILTENDSPMDMGGVLQTGRVATSSNRQASDDQVDPLVCELEFSDRWPP